MSAPVVEFENVTKTFPPVTAVDAVSLAIPESCIYGFIGPNGSGKTTAMRMIVGIISPDRGSVRVFGGSSLKRQLGTIGYLPEERGIYRKMTVRALLRFHAELRGSREAVSQADAWLERLRLSPVASNLVETLSKGTTQKVQFIAAVIADPKLLILDEPFSGLDPVSAEEMRAAILELKRNGSTIVLSTHDMSTAEQMCERILMIFRGKKVLDGTLGEIQDRYGEDTLRVSVQNANGFLARIPGVELLRDLGQIQELRISKGTDPQEVLRALVANTRLNSFAIAKPSLEDIFIRIAGADAVSNTREAANA